MRNLILSFVAVSLIQSISVHASTVTTCTFETMKPLIEESLKEYVVKTMEDRYIDVAPNAVVISYRGMKDFYDHFSEVKQEHGFDVSFKTKNGTEMKAFSTIDENCDIQSCYNNKPLNFVVSIPEPIIKTEYDNEGNIIGEKCIVRSHGRAYRFIIFLNTITGKVVERNPVSDHHSIMTIADIQK